MLSWLSGTRHRERTRRGLIEDYIWEEVNLLFDLLPYSMADYTVPVSLANLKNANGHVDRPDGVCVLDINSIIV
jgi:hypothetical protein